MSNPKRRKQLRTKKKTMSVPEAGREYFDLGRNASYDAAKAGVIPTIRVGRRLRAVVAALDRMLEEAGRDKRTTEK